MCDHLHHDCLPRSSLETEREEKGLPCLGILCENDFLIFFVPQKLKISKSSVIKKKKMRVTLRVLVTAGGRRC